MCSLAAVHVFILHSLLDAPHVSLTLSLIIRYIASCRGRQVLLGLSYTGLQSRCSTHNRTHMKVVVGDVIYLSAHYCYTVEVLDCVLEGWNSNSRTYFLVSSYPDCVKYQDVGDRCEEDVHFFFSSHQLFKEGPP